MTTNIKTTIITSHTNLPTTNIKTSIIKSIILTTLPTTNIKTTIITSFIHTTIPTTNIKTNIITSFIHTTIPTTNIKTNIITSYIHTTLPTTNIKTTIITSFIHTTIPNTNIKTNSITSVIHTTLPTTNIKTNIITSFILTTLPTTNIKTTIITSFIHTTLPSTNIKTTLLSSLIYTTLPSINIKTTLLSSLIYTNFPTTNTLLTSLINTTLPITNIKTTLLTSLIYTTFPTTNLKVTTISTMNFYTTFPNYNIFEDCFEGQCFKINTNLINFGLGWDYIKKQVHNLDLSIEGLDENNNLIDNVYFGKLQGFNKSIKLSNNNLNGKGNGDDEVIFIDLEKIPYNIVSLVILIKDSNFGNIKGGFVREKNDVNYYYTNAFIRIYENNSKKEIDKYSFNEGKAGGISLYGILERKREDNFWIFRKMNELSFNETNSFYKIYLNEFNPKQINHPLPNEIILAKGMEINILENTIFIGLGWENFKRIIYDLDFYYIEFDKSKNILENLGPVGLQILSLSPPQLHLLNQDNRIGNGKEDDEILEITLSGYNSRVTYIGIIIFNSKGFNLTKLKSGYIRFYSSKTNYGCLRLESNISSILLIGFFSRNTINGKISWIFRVMNLPLEYGYGLYQAQDILKNSFR